MYEALSEPMNMMAFAISSGVPMRLLGICDSRKFAFLRLGKVVEHSRFHRTRANDIDPNACAGEFDRRRLRDAFHGVLAADIHRRSWATDFAVRRRDVHETTTRAPSRAKATAVARPMPVSAPVIKTTVELIANTPF
jgi:hypothetical protein